MLIRHATASV